MTPKHPEELAADRLMVARDAGTGISMRFIQSWNPPAHHLDFFDISVPQGWGTPMTLTTRTLPAGTIVLIGGLPVRLAQDTHATSSRGSWEAIDDHLRTHALSEPSRAYDPPLTLDEAPTRRADGID